MQLATTKAQDLVMAEISQAIRTVTQPSSYPPSTPCPACSIQEAEPDMVILGGVVTCSVCRAYLDGFFRQCKDGFCPACGTHLPTLKEKQKRKARLARLYRMSVVI